MTQTAHRSTLLPDALLAALWKSEGFWVETPEGRMGTVEDTVRIPGLKRPAALAVCLCGHEKRVVLVPVTDVVDVETDTRTIRLRELPAG